MQNGSYDNDSKVKEKGNIGKADGNGNDSKVINLGDGNETNNNMIQFSFTHKYFDLQKMMPK